MSQIRDRCGFCSVPLYVAELSVSLKCIEEFGVPAVRTDYIQQGLAVATSSGTLCEPGLVLPVHKWKGLDETRADRKALAEPQRK